MYIVDLLCFMTVAGWELIITTMTEWLQQTNIELWLCNCIQYSRRPFLQIGHLCPAILITPPGCSQQITAAGLKALALDPAWLTKHPPACPRAKQVQCHGQPSQKRQHGHESGLHIRPTALEPKWLTFSPSGLPLCQRLRSTKLRPGIRDEKKVHLERRPSAVTWPLISRWQTV